MSKLAFALDLLKQRWKEPVPTCPYCQSVQSHRVDRKFLLLEARKCDACTLVFRWPGENTQKNSAFYQNDYEGAHATYLPSEQELAKLKEENFSDSVYSAEYYQGVLAELGVPTSGRLLDFGCSWGYFTYQFSQQKYVATGFEISKPRAAYGRKNFGLEIIEATAQLIQTYPNTFDLIFTAHVLEHAANLGETIKMLTTVAKKGGTLVVIVPNAGCALPGYTPVTTLGKEHIIGFTAEWFEKNLPPLGWKINRIASSDPTKILRRDALGDTLIVSATRL